MTNTDPRMTPITTDKTRAAGGHYSQAMQAGGMIYVSGQLGFMPGVKEPIIGTIQEQTRNCLTSLEAILHAAGSSLNRVVKTTVYVSDSDHWPEVNRVYGEIFGDHKPARAIVPCKSLHYGFDVEIEAVALA